MDSQLLKICVGPKKRNASHNSTKKGTQTLPVEDKLGGLNSSNTGVNMYTILLYRIGGFLSQT